MNPAERRVLVAALEWYRRVRASDKATSAPSGAPVHQKAIEAEDALRRACEKLEEAEKNRPS